MPSVARLILDFRFVLLLPGGIQAVRSWGEFCYRWYPNSHPWKFFLKFYYLK